MHVLFSDSAAGTLKQVVAGRKSGDKVVSLGDCLAIGPIGTGDFADRKRWFEAQVQESAGWDWLAESAARFLATIREWRGDRLAWIAPRSACEQCGLQWAIAQLDGVFPGPMIIADRPIAFRNGASVPLGLGELGNAQMADLLDRATRREWPDERASPAVWQRLRAEDSLLRIIEGGELRSVDADRFDPLIVGRVPANWTKWSRVAGHAMVDAMDQGHHTTDVFFLWRLRELVIQGRIACKGELPGGDHDGASRPTALLRRA